MLDSIYARPTQQTPPMRYIFVLVVGALLGIAIGGPWQAETGAKPTAKATPPPPPVRVVEKKSRPATQDVHMVARALYSETKQMAGYEYIAWVIRNRVDDPRYPNSVRGVVLEPKQFSAFNSRTKRARLMSMTYPETKDTHFRRAYRMAEYVLAAPAESNPLPGVTHFFMSETMERLYGKEKPAWAKGPPTYVHGQIHFHNLDS